jgi:flagellar biosynthesis protein FlhG
MMHLSVEDLCEKTGLSKARLRYLEARFPSHIQRRLFDPEGRFYSESHIHALQQLDVSTREFTPTKPQALKTSGIPGKLLVFASGKGGVGKTSLAVNLCVAASLQGRLVTLVDGDLGMANAHILLGNILLGHSPKKNLSHLLFENTPLQDILVQTPQGLHFLPGGGGVWELAYLNEKQMSLLSDAINTLRTQTPFVIIDAPAGIGPSVLGWVLSATELVLVTNPTKTALLDAYGLIKVALEKGYEGPIRVIVNQVQSASQGEKIFQHLNQCAQRFLKYSLSHLGSVRKDLRFERAQNSGIPLMLHSEHASTHTILTHLAMRLFN